MSRGSCGIQYTSKGSSHGPLVALTSLLTTTPIVSTPVYLIISTSDSKNCLKLALGSTYQLSLTNSVFGFKFLLYQLTR